MLVDDLCLGIRTSDGRLDGLLEAALRSHALPGVEAPPNLSLLFGDDHGPAHAFHFLYCGHERVVRTASLGRLLRATVAYLNGFADPPPDMSRLRAKVLCHDRGAILIDPFFGFWLEPLERRLGRIGLHVVDAPDAVIDQATLELVIEEPRLNIDADVFAEVDRGLASPVPEAITEPGRRRMLVLVVPDSAASHPHSASRTSSVSATDRKGRVGTADLEALVEVTRSCPVHRVAMTSGERDLLQALRSIVA